MKESALYDTGAELAFINDAMIEPSVLDECEVSPDDISNRMAKRTLSILVDMHQSGKYIGDVALVSQALRLDPEIDSDQVLPFLGKVAQAGEFANLSEHVSKILNASKKRRLADVLANASAKNLDPRTQAASVCDRLTAEVSAIGATGAKDESRLVGDVAKEVMITIREAAVAQRSMGLPTGLYELDQVLGGLHRSEMLIVGGQPGGGKTALAMSIGRYVAEHDRPVSFLSLEMSAAELTQRYICSDAGVNSQDVRSGNLSTEELERLQAAADRLEGIPLHIWDTPLMTMPSIRANTRRHQATRGVDLLIVDYLSLITPDASTRNLETRHQVGDAAKRLKQLARELNIALLCLAQVSREGAKSGRLKMHHLAESADVERNADSIVFLNNGDRPGEVIFGIEKQRNGPKGELTFHFDAERTRFIDSLSEERRISEWQAGWREDLKG